MVNGSIITTDGKKTFLYRAVTENGSLSSTQYLPGTQFSVGINSETPNVNDTTLDEPIPITNGTVLDDGDNQFTGSSGGDNSTDNTSIYKDGAGVTDVTAQNLIKNNTNATAIWTISDLSSNGTNATATSNTGLWLYILDATALAKFVSSGTALEIKLGSDASNYYSITYTASQLSTGWQWLDFGVLNTLTETGTVSGNIDTFIIEITTNNATDEFVAGDVVYDLLRQWVSTDVTVDIDVGYPSLNLSALEATTRCTLTVDEANGFNVDGMVIKNEDSSPLVLGKDTFPDESKSPTDEVIITVIDRVL